MRSIPNYEKIYEIDICQKIMNDELKEYRSHWTSHLKFIFNSVSL